MAHVEEDPGIEQVGEGVNDEAHLESRGEVSGEREQGQGERRGLTRTQRTEEPRKHGSQKDRAGIFSMEKDAEQLWGRLVKPGLLTKNMLYPIPPNQGPRVFHRSMLLCCAL